MITVTKLESGYWHIRGDGPCNWAQPPCWPCSYEVLVEHAFPEAGPLFLRKCQEIIDQDESGEP